jgi:NAD(P)-dependent dehydrogenase (short-subunit alcohol dehydrogenase family)
MDDFTGAWAIVTGGAGGIGAGAVEALQGRGARVASIDLKAGGPADVCLSCDVSDEASVDDAVARAVAQLGGVHYAFCNAGVAGMGALLTMPMAEYDRVMSTNLRGMVLTVRAVARAMRDGGNGGAIVCTSSSAAITADIGMMHYSLAKAGVTQLVRVAARELAPYGIRINSVAPGPTATPMMVEAEQIPGYYEHLAARTPLGRIGSPDDIAEAVVGLLGMRWVTGQTLVVDGGITQCSPCDIPGVDAGSLLDW